MPTLVHNVQTLAAVPWIIRNGAAAFAAIGTPDSPGTILVQVRTPSGDGIAEVPLGTPLRDVIGLGGRLPASRSIKAVLVGSDHAVLATGGHDWENAFVDRLWTYPLEDAWTGLRSACSALGDLGQVDALGISAMMHGYLAFDAMESHLAGHDYLAAERYTIADITLYAYTHVAHEGGFDMGGYPAIAAWIERVASQPNHIPITA